TGAVDTDAGKFAQLNVPGVGSNSTWRSAPPIEKYWSQHKSWFKATMIEPRQPEYVAFIAPSCGAEPSFSNTSFAPFFLSVSITRWVRRSPGPQPSTELRSRPTPAGRRF